MTMITTALQVESVLRTRSNGVGYLYCLAGNSTMILSIVSLFPFPKSLLTIYLYSSAARVGMFTCRVTSLIVFIWSGQKCSGPASVTALMCSIRNIALW